MSGEKDNQDRALSTTLGALREQYAGNLPDHITLLGVDVDKDTNAPKVIVECELHGEVEMSATSFAVSACRCPTCQQETIGYRGQRLQRLLKSGDAGERVWAGLVVVEVFGVHSAHVTVTRATIDDCYQHYLKDVLYKAEMREIDALILEQRVMERFKGYRDLQIYQAGMKLGQRWCGDAECFEPSLAPVLKTFMETFVRRVQTMEPDYQAAFELLEGPVLFEREKGFPKLPINPPIEVVCVDTGERFASIRAAERAKGIGGIGEVLRSDARHLAGGCRWVTAEDFDAGRVPEASKGGRRKRPVICLDTGDRYESVLAAKRATGITSIQGAASGRRSSAGGCRWAYVDEFDAGESIVRPIKHRYKAVRCIDTDETYLSATDAAKAAGISLTAISLACNGQRKTAGKKRWEYVDAG